MTETATSYNVDAIASELTELEQLNLKVAAIAAFEKISKPETKPEVIEATFG